MKKAYRENPLIDFQISIEIGKFRKNKTQVDWKRGKSKQREKQTRLNTNMRSGSRDNGDSITKKLREFNRPSVIAFKSRENGIEIILCVSMERVLVVFRYTR